MTTQIDTKNHFLRVQKPNKVILFARNYEEVEPEEDEKKAIAKYRKLGKKAKFFTFEEIQRSLLKAHASAI